MEAYLLEPGRTPRHGVNLRLTLCQGVAVVLGQGREHRVYVVVCGTWGDRTTSSLPSRK